MFCKKCGFSLEEHAGFCPNCGEATRSTSQTHVSIAAPGTTSEPARNNPPPSPYTYHNVKKRDKPKKKPVGFLKVLIFLVIVAILVQAFVYPFLIQKISLGKISTVFVKRVDPEESYDGVTEAETKSVRSYLIGVKRAYSWQLSGREKKIYNIASRYLKDPPYLKASSASSLQASILPGIVLASASTGQKFSEEEIASDLSGIASILLQRGYTKLAITLSALAAENSPVDPLIINNLSCALRAEGLTEDAYKLLGYAYKLSPDSPEILTNMGNICLDQGDADLASTWYDMALAQDDDFGLAHEGLMLYYMNQKRYEVAMRHMIKASETTFTPAVYKTYERLCHLEEYEDIRDNVLSGFDFSDISKTYQRTRDQSREDIDTPAGQIKIPKFPTYSNAESLMSDIGGMHEYAMSIFNPALGELKKIGEMAKQAEDMIKAFQSKGIGGVVNTAKELGFLEGTQASSNATISDGKFQLSMDYTRELYTIGLLGDYLDMRLKEPMEKMNEKFASAGDPLTQAAERSIREFENRGESEEAWLGAMASNWGNSMSLSSGTISANKANLNQHINEFYGAILPAYNEIKPDLEEYWLYAGGVIKYAGDENVFKSLDSQRKVKLYGNLAIFAVYAEFEAINVPLVYSMYAVQGQVEVKPEEEKVEKLEEPKDEVPMPDETFSLDLGIVEVEWSDGELEVEVTALIAASVKYNHQKGTATLAGGVGLSSGDFVPMLGGKATATY